MKKKARFRFLLVFLPLILGWALFHWINPEAFVGESSGFRSWLWENRGLDLVVQVLLVFAGALGIAAILPIEGADD